MRILNKRKILKFFRKKIIFAIDFILILGFIYLGYFLYQNLYLGIINPPPPTLTQISIKEETINEDLLNNILEKLDNKKEGLNNIEFSDPFD